MLKKACITQAFRLAFPEEVSMLPYEESEILEPTNEITTEAVKEVKELSKEPLQEPPKNKEEKISEAQKRRLWVIANKTAEEYGLSKEIVETVIRGVLSQYNLEHTRDISRKDYDTIVEKIIKEIEEIAKEGGN
jgi:C-terminal processing protease CtpA/Prc